MLHHLTQCEPHSPFPPFYCYFLPVSSHSNWLQKRLSAFDALKFLLFPPSLALIIFFSHSAFPGTTEPTSKKHYHSLLCLIVRHFVGFFLTEVLCITELYCYA